MKVISTACSMVLLLANPTFAKDGDPATPAEVVKKLYTEHLANKGPLADATAKKSWSTLFGADLLKALKSGNWGFDPLVFAQDHELKDPVFKEIDRDDSGNVFVLVTFKNFDQSVRLIVAMKKSGEGYLIENIVEPATGIDLINNLSNGEE